mgnify:CR=1 FL=1
MIRDRCIEEHIRVVDPSVELNVSIVGETLMEANVAWNTFFHTDLSAPGEVYTGLVCDVFNGDYLRVQPIEPLWIVDFGTYYVESNTDWEVL